MAIKINDRLHSTAGSDIPAEDHVVAAAQEIFDDFEDKRQSEINEEAARIGDEYGEAIIPEILAGDALLIKPQVLTELQRSNVNANINNRGEDNTPFGGMGRIFLKPNIQEVEGEEKNLLTQQMISKPNTIYVIQYDYELAENITVPANCVLKFDGGSISGAYTITGTNTGIQAGLVKIFGIDITLAGIWNIEKIDIRWFGVVADNNNIDCTPIINKIKDIYVPIYFPKGSYYLSEFYYSNTKQERLVIKGDGTNGLGPNVVFNPFNPSQRYIIKIGGGVDSLGGSNKGYNIVIEDISFRTPQGYTPGQLTNSYPSGTSEYLNGGLILDNIEIGKFAVGGSSIHNMPVLTIGHIYECEFEYIVCYGNHGKSVQPVIQFLGDYVDATHIKKLICEVVVGPVIKSLPNSMFREVIIDDFYFEGTIQWERESITSEERYRDIIDFSDYNIVPIIDVSNEADLTVVAAAFNSVNTKWVNTLDNYEKQCVRGFLNVDTFAGNITFLNIENSAYADYLYIRGNRKNNYKSHITILHSNSDYQVELDRVSLNVNKPVLDSTGKGYISLIKNYIYKNGELRKIAIPYRTNDISASLTGIVYGDVEPYIYGAYPICEIVNNRGFSLIDADCVYLVLQATTAGTQSFELRYYDDSDNVIGSLQKSVTCYYTSRKYKLCFPLEYPSGCKYFKIFDTRNGYPFNLFEFGVFDANAIPIEKIGTVRPAGNDIVPGFQYFDTNPAINKPIWFKGIENSTDIWVDATGTSL